MSIKNIIIEEINNIEVIDVHSHLFPENHGEFLLFGIDNLLTYHYLISELFVIWNDMSITDFYKLPKKIQADIIWEELFIKRTPISEACRGVLTTCNKLGLSKYIETRDLDSLRTYFDKIKNNKDKLNDYISHIFELSNVKYTIMTNQIFDIQEIKCLSKELEIPKYLKTSLRIDKLIFDFDKSCEFISKFDFSPDIDGMKNYIRYWYSKLNPEYFMASLPADFEYYIEECKDIVFKMNPTNVIDLVIVPLSIELNLPIAFKFGTKRGTNPSLKDAGDSLGVASVESLANLCKINNKCKFLATFLSKVNQHQLCVVARNFPNLHIYGCWWFLNNPSLINEITKMRIEMLGFGFTAQHSDARVLEQLLYKWNHSKEIIGNVLVEKYNDIQKTGWKITREEIKRDISYLFGNSYEEFMKKKI